MLRNLPSMAAAGGFAAASGPVDVQFSGSNAFVVMGWGGDPALRAGLGDKSRLFGTLLLVTPNGLSFPVTDISANESQHNPAGGAGRFQSIRRAGAPGPAASSPTRVRTP